MVSTALVGVLVTVCLVATVVACCLFTVGLTRLVKEIAAGAPLAGRWTRMWVRVFGVLDKVLSHRMFKGNPLIAAAHWLVMVSFVLLVFSLVRAYGQLFSPGWNLPLLGDWVFWSWLTELAAWLGLLAITALMWVRSWARRTPTSSLHTSRFFGSTSWQAHFVEWVIWVVCLCVLVLHSLEFAWQETATGLVSRWDYPLTWFLGEIWLACTLSATQIATLILVAGAVKILVSMAWLGTLGLQTQMGVAWHRFLGPINMLTGRNATGTKALGALAPPTYLGAPILDLEAALDDPDFTIGLGQTTDLTWKDRLDFLTCTECGRCQDLCPAWNTGKPLSPKLLNLALREQVSLSRGGKLSALEASADVFSALKARETVLATEMPTEIGPLVGEFLNPDVLWDCTMCGACVEQCPVDIEHVDRIANLRRYQTLMESAFPRELVRPFKGMETKKNPYNRPPKKRLEWAKNLDFEVPVVFEDAPDATEFDYLFWVGCAGAYDDKAQKTTLAVAELLHTAGVSFAVLGNAESCTGDPARRAGNEILFQMLARQVIDTLQEAKAQKIVVTCAHCFNTIANEFPELDGKFEVIHHTQLLNRLVKEGRLSPVAPAVPAESGDPELPKITYHDPCFLGRHNREFRAPRELLDSFPGVERVEMEASRSRAMCCGAGGARAWMEETRGSRIAETRMSQAAATGAKIVATACPFCTQMLGSVSSLRKGAENAPLLSAVRGEVNEDLLTSTLEVENDASITASAVSEAKGDSLLVPAPEVKDVAILLLDSVRRGRSKSHPHP